MKIDLSVEELVEINLALFKSYTEILNNVSGLDRGVETVHDSILALEKQADKLSDLQRRLHKCIMEELKENKKKKDVQFS